MRIVIADHESSTRSALGMLIQSQPDMEVVGEASDLVELLCQIKSKLPHLIILCWDDLGDRVDALLDLLCLFRSPPAIVGLSVRSENRKAAINAGVSGFACKEEPPERLVATIREVASTWLPEPRYVVTQPTINTESES